MAINKTLGTVKDQEEERLAVDNFLRNFYTKGSCKAYQEYRQLDKKEKVIKIGSLLKNMRRPGKGEKQAFEYRVASIAVCKEFFRFYSSYYKKAKMNRA